eukprot:scaffold16860_cov72-Skeletonema_dohrnii-CCMP3373.AAC.4
MSSLANSCPWANESSKTSCSAVAAVTGIRTHSQRGYHNQFLSRRRVVSCNTDDDCTRVEMAITKKTSENVMSMISSIGDRTVSMDDR